MFKTGTASRVKTKISITMPEELLRAVDRLAKRQGRTRSGFVETAVRAFIRPSLQEEQNARDLEIIDRNADARNKEAADVLEYQVLP